MKLICECPPPLPATYGGMGGYAVCHRCGMKRVDLTDTYTGTAHPKTAHDAGEHPRTHHTANSDCHVLAEFLQQRGEHGATADECTDHLRSRGRDISPNQVAARLLTLRKERLAYRLSGYTRRTRTGRDGMVHWNVDYGPEAGKPLIR